MNAPSDTWAKIDLEDARFEAYLAELFELEPLTDLERADLLASVEAARGLVAHS